MNSDSKMTRYDVSSVIKRKRGIALMLVLLALIIMSVVIVDFQGKSALFQRSSAGRINLQKCRYGAESGLILAQRMIKIALKKNSWVDFNDEGIDEPNSNEYALNTLEEQGGEDPNNLNDPNDLNDPNTSDEFNLDFLENPFILAQKEIEVGDVKVTFEIQDENGKFPLLWYLRSPYSTNGNGSGAKQLDAFFKLMNIDREYGALVKKLANDIVKDIALDYMELHLVKNEHKKGQRRTSRRTRPRSTYSKKQAQKAKRYEDMALFGTQWRKRILEDDEMAVLALPINDEGLVLSDYLGVWGTFKINLFTAPAEVIESSFAELGVTHDMALSMVEYREENEIKTVLDFNNAPDVDATVISDLYKASIFKTENFSVYVKATCGNASYKLVTNMQNYLGKLHFTAIVKE